MDIRKASLDDKVKVCSTYYKWGFAFLPWLWYAYVASVSLNTRPGTHTHTNSVTAIHVSLSRSHVPPTMIVVVKEWSVSTTMWRYTCVPLCPRVIIEAE